MKKFLTEKSFSLLHVIAITLLANLIHLGASTILDIDKRYHVINTEEVK